MSIVSRVIPVQFASVPEEKSSAKMGGLPPCVWTVIGSEETLSALVLFAESVAFTRYVCVLPEMSPVSVNPTVVVEELTTCPTGVGLPSREDPVRYSDRSRPRRPPTSAGSNRARRSHPTASRAWWGASHRPTA